MHCLTFEQFSWGSHLLDSNYGLLLLHDIAEVCSSAVLLLSNSPSVLLLGSNYGLLLLHNIQKFAHGLSYFWAILLAFSPSRQQSWPPPTTRHYRSLRMRCLTFAQFSWRSPLLDSNHGLLLLHDIAEVCACAVLLLSNSPGVLLLGSNLGLLLLQVSLGTGTDPHIHHLPPDHLPSICVGCWIRTVMDVARP